ncbi:MAG: hypothetical protein IIB81_01420 [Nanoarchaeota archaeon]|nr:hypothetical protein [Nanoarchaeota archaeon]
MKNYIKFCKQNSLKPSTFESLQAYKTKIMKKKETPEDKKIRLIQLKRAKLEQIQLLLHLQKIKNAKKSN